jgi:hypothetical protein
MRWLLQAVVLTKSADSLDPVIVASSRNHPNKAMSQCLMPLLFERLETGLHVLTVRSQVHPKMADAIRPNPLPIIPTLSAFAATPDAEELPARLEEHREIYDLIPTGEIEAAAQALERHIRGALSPNIERLRGIAPVPESLSPPIPAPADATRGARRLWHQRVRRQGRTPSFAGNRPRHQGDIMPRASVP